MRVTSKCTCQPACRQRCSISVRSGWSPETTTSADQAIEPGLFERPQRAQCLPHAVETAETHEYTPQAPVALRAPSARLRELLAQQREPRPEQALGVRRHTRVVSRLRVEKKVLVQQRIAHVIAVGQIVDDENAPDVRLNDAFPARIQRVVIDDQPVGTVACTQHRGCLGRVQLLRHRQPRGVCERRAPVRLEIGGAAWERFRGRARVRAGA